MGKRRATTSGETLFSASARKADAEDGSLPLAERMRPRTLDEVCGQQHLVGEGRFLARAIEADRVPSIVLWGPPGVGKTTLGKVIAGVTRSEFVMFSAVLGSLAELREIVAAAKERRDYHGKRTLVFVDEIHRFNKAQQDAFLPHVEAGVITLVGATTENPSFAVNAALLSRCKVFRLEPLEHDELSKLVRRALADDERGLGKTGLTIDDEALDLLVKKARGDGRRALTSLEIAASSAELHDERAITTEGLARAEDDPTLLYDKSGEEHYNVTSAFIKSLRGSDPDAAVYYLMRMLEAGDDPLFLLRRMMIFASEDVGLADPRALIHVEAADAAFRRIGMPEGIYPLTQAALYLACTQKSNAVKNAWQRAKALVAEHGALAVPKKLRNAVTKHMKAEGYGKGYRYAHDYEDGVVPGERYLPEAIEHERIYEPTDRGEEARIQKRLASLRGEGDGS